MPGSQMHMQFRVSLLHLTAAGTTTISYHCLPLSTIVSSCVRLCAVFIDTMSCNEHQCYHSLFLRYSSYKSEQDESENCKPCDLDVKCVRRRRCTCIVSTPDVCSCLVPAVLIRLGYSWQFCTTYVVMIVIMTCCCLQVMAAVGQQQNSNCEGS